MHASLFVRVDPKRRKPLRSKLLRTGKFKEVLVTSHGLRVMIGGRASVKKMRECREILARHYPRRARLFTTRKAKPEPSPKTTKRDRRRKETVKKGHMDYYIFFDIDSTLTKKLGIVETDVRKIFQRMKEQNTAVIFCTGRSAKDIGWLIKEYGTSKYGIAEAGGIIIGTEHPYHRFGSIQPPKKVIKYMKDHGIEHIYDPDQHPRLTEYVLRRNPATESGLARAVKNTDNVVDCHSTPNTIHVTKKDVNKGTAIKHLASVDLQLDRDIDKLIGVGDSQLDFPMFEECDENYLVAKRNSKMHRKAMRNKSLKIAKRLNPAPDSIRELYRILYGDCA